jgi:predicted ATP-dependent serine protease
VYDLISYLKTTKIDQENISNVVQTAKAIINDRNNIQFGFDEGLDFFNPESHLQPSTDTFSSGYEYIDLVLGGGFYSKALFCFIGEMKIGKSIWLANLAANSVKMGYNTAVISLEMRDRKVTKRLGANLLGIPMKEYGPIADDQVGLKKRLSNLGYDSLQVPGKIYVKEFPTSAAGVPDVEMWLKKMEEIKGIKFKVIVLDYINILKNWRNPNSENTYMKIKQIAEDLRAMAMRNEWCIVTATQVNRSGFGSTDLNATNISESAALGHTVDAMFGIIQDEMMHANREYILKLIANRDDGYKNSRKKFLINYDLMRIIEDADSQIIND